MDDDTSPGDAPDSDDFDPTDADVSGMAEELGEQTLGAIKFDSLSPTDFEEFCFDLMSESGFTNVDWRKGTPKDASPSDRGPLRERSVREGPPIR